MRSEAEMDAIVHDIIGCGIEVHKTIGPGCFESAYLPCLVHQLARKSIAVASSVWLDLVYEDLIVSRAYQIDLIVADCVVVEIKAIEQLAKVHSRQVSTYLKLTGFPVGLILNFGAETMSAGIKRIANNFPVGTTPIGRRTPILAAASAAPSPPGF